MKTVWYVGTNFCTKDFQIAKEGGFNKNIYIVEKNLKTPHEKEKAAIHAKKIFKKFGIK